MAGSAIVRRLSAEHCDILIASRDEVDLRRQADVEAWIERARPDAVFVAAAKVGGIKANDSLPAEFLYDNLAIEIAVIHSAWKAGVKKLLFLGSTCVYPKMAPQPMPENALLTGPLEPTNEWYAVAKIAGIKLCEAYRRQYGADFISVMPTNLYGRGDNYHPDHSHVPAALIRRMHEAKLKNAPQVSIWGTGTPRREFLFADDLADACVFLMQRYSGEEMVNIGIGDGHDHRRVRPHRRRRGRLQGRARLRHLAARRHAAQARRHDEAESSRLAGEDAAARRARQGV